MSNPLKQYLDTLSPAQYAAFAVRAGTSTDTLRVTAGAYRTGGLALSPEFAARLEKASRGALRRQDLAPVCAKCPHTKTTK